MKKNLPVENKKNLQPRKLSVLRITSCYSNHHICTKKQQQQQQQQQKIPTIGLDQTKINHKQQTQTKKKKETNKVNK